MVCFRRFVADFGLEFAVMPDSVDYVREIGEI